MKILAFIILLSFLNCNRDEIPLSVRADFLIYVANNDSIVPVDIILENKSIGADNYYWELPGANNISSTEKEPQEIIYNKKGKYTITLFAKNRDSITDSISKSLVFDTTTKASFKILPLTDLYAPTYIEIKNLSEGNLTDTWFLDNAPVDYSNPFTLAIETPGKHYIKLITKNLYDSDTIIDSIHILGNSKAAFTYFLNNENQNQSNIIPPLTGFFKNLSENFTSSIWKIAKPDNKIDIFNSSHISYNFDQAGQYKVSLEVSNGKSIDLISKDIEIATNTNLWTFQDIKFGTHYAHITNTYPAFFSTYLNKSFTREKYADSIGKYIDIVFFANNENFFFCKFISPYLAEDESFFTIDKGQNNLFYNLLEFSTFSFSSDDFDNLTDDIPLQKFYLSSLDRAIQDFDNSTTPRVVLFQTYDGRKGAIKIKSFVSNGQQSYILTDIKIQKIPR